MVGTKGHGGGARPNTGGARENAGRPPGSGDGTLSAARLIPPAQKCEFAEKALAHAERMLEILVDIAEHGDSEAARVAAAAKLSTEHLAKRHSMSISQRCVTLRSSTARPPKSAKR
jgi:hypothetical protein